MKRPGNILVWLILFSTSTIVAAEDLRSGFINGDPEIKSIHALTFGTDGILFIGDSKSATIFAIDTKDAPSSGTVEDIDVKQIDKMIAASLGTQVENIIIQDMAVHPESKRVFLAVHHIDGTPVLITIEKGQPMLFDLKAVFYSKMVLPYAVAEDAKDDRGRSLRGWAISDLDYFEGQVLVSGLSTKEFSSSLTMLPFPFSDKHDVATLEIWHAAHGAYETHSPIKTFTTTMVNGQAHIVASYTCTPLVLFPLSMLKEGQHVMGRTVAELGNRNTPLDIISMEKGGKSYLLMANTSRALMKISYEHLEAFQGGLTDPVEENSGTAGIDFISLPLVNILQLDKLDDSRFLMLQRKSNGDLDLYTSTADRWL